MVRIQLVNHLCYIVNGVIHPWIGVAVVQLVSNEPGQHGGMIAVLEDLLAHNFKLLGYGIGIVIVEAVPLGLHRQPQGDSNSVRMGLVQQRPCILVFLERTPGAYRVAAMRSESLQVIGGDIPAPRTVYGSPLLTSW